MKFLQLRHAIEIALGQLPEPEPKVEPRTIPLYDPDKHKRRRELVAGGEVIWKPVNKLAAMVIAKAPWWAKPPPPDPLPLPPPLPEKKKRTHRPRARKVAAVAPKPEPVVVAVLPQPNPNPSRSCQLTASELAERWKT